MKPKRNEWFITAYPKDETSRWTFVLALWDEENGEWNHIYHNFKPLGERQVNNGAYYHFSNMEVKTRFENQQEALDYAELVKQAYIKHYHYQFKENDGANTTA